MIRHKTTASTVVPRTLFYTWNAHRQLAHLLRRPSAYNHAMLVTRRMFRALTANDRYNVWRLVSAKINGSDRENTSMRFIAGSERLVRVRIVDWNTELNMICLMGIALITPQQKVTHRMRIMYCENPRAVLLKE